MAPVELTADRRGVVVLGASNVSRGLARLAATVRSRAGTPLELFVAAGHGRGYAVSSRVGLRRLPSILGSGLWRALDREGIAKPYALLTDVGNELLYGLGITAVARGVREAAARLADRGATLAVTGLPLASIERVGRVRYRLLRTLYVPGCLLSLTEIHDASRWLDDELRVIAADTGATFLEQPADWYGLDAIHVKRSRLDDLWASVGDAWKLPPAGGRARASLTDWATLGSRAAEVRSLARIPRLTRQPVVERGGMRVSMY